MALRLKLKAGERVIISGAVIRNGTARTELLIENEVPLLREPDILSPRAVRTPCERIYLALQLLYVDPERSDEHLATFRALITDVAQAAPSCRRFITAIESHVAAGQLYQALKSAKALLQHEYELLNHVH
jgi:flagellar protein FlbT